MSDELASDIDTLRTERSTRAPPMVAVYRHDIQKLRTKTHEPAADTFAGVPVNEPVPCNADHHAALMSRPAGKPEQTEANHDSPYRLSLLTGTAQPDTDRLSTAADSDVRDLVTPTNPARLHARWLTSDLAAVVNESVNYPYTSLQYHVLLTAALLDAYLEGHDFEDLWLSATAPDESTKSTADATPSTTETTVANADMDEAASALAAPEVRPNRTILWTPVLALHLTASPDDRAVARLPSRPTRSFGDTWARLSAHPIDVDGHRRWRLLDAQLRRIRSWSTALAYIDEFVERFGATAGGDGT